MGARKKRLMSATPRPAVPDVPLSDYEQGALAALAVLAKVRAEQEAPTLTANVGAAHAVLNGIQMYGQRIQSETERRVNGHLRERWQARRDAAALAAKEPTS